MCLYFFYDNISYNLHFSKKNVVSLILKSAQKAFRGRQNRQVRKIGRQDRQIRQDGRLGRRGRGMS